MNLGGKTTNPGELRTRITLKRRSVSIETGGFQTPVLTTIAVVWAKWTNAHGQEAWLASSIQAEMPATVLIRFRTDVDQTCVVVKGSTTFEIISLDNIGERGEYIELKVKRLVPG